ncbi:MAG: 16S rRNA (cytidine(1402)-2'-O)-methyltransferase, partial [Proteobacteria bacterium]|nr:16S rRNA (cytidine(1402)-2'-O)-methyltransferase [Pseudomonadota bacterium]MBU1710745.1 16S rRNA (cytidine(1402)-2'-O)-methyltransferase [Pseudomonadota bacterium]
GGEDVAVVSDAGTPGISDPGGILVSRARECGIPVVPLPGPSAVIAALSASGFKDTKFLFLGFLPSKVNQRRQQLEAVAQEKASIVFYESPARVLKSLADCLKIFGDRRAVVARELTKIYEEFLTGSLGEIVSEIGSRETIKGEYVVIIEGASSGEKPARTEDLSEILKWYKAQGVSLSEAVKAISRDLGVSRSELYTRALNIWDSSG